MSVVLLCQTNELSVFVYVGGPRECVRSKEKTGQSGGQSDLHPVNNAVPCQALYSKYTNTWAQTQILWSNVL